MTVRARTSTGAKGLSRRELLRRGALLGLSGGAVTALLSACGGAGPATTAPASPATGTASTAASPGASARTAAAAPAVVPSATGTRATNTTGGTATRTATAGAAATRTAGAGAGADVTLPPIIFVHGNGDSSALWITTVWRFESNGWSRDRLFALDYPYPNARDDDAVPQPSRSSTAEQRANLAARVDELLARTGATKVALIGNSRGGNSIRNYLKNGGGAAKVSHAILCGTPNHGVYNTPGNNSEFNETQYTTPAALG
jgi:triacylglycerol esterase/lipase EstA (alpha/beta hydrolase family)